MLQSRECSDKCGDAEEEMYRVRHCDEVEEVAAGVGAEEDMLCGELVPGQPLACKE